MDEIVISANRRFIVGKQVKALRQEGSLPAVLYGRHIDTIPIKVDLRDASRTLIGLSPSALINLDLDGETHYALVREKQRDVLLGTLLHVDFQAVSLTEKVRANVAIDLVGEAPAVVEEGLILVTNVEQLDVEALPRELPDRIEVDVSNLMEVGDAIYVRDLALPGEVEIFAEPDDVIVVVSTPVAELEEEVEEEEVEEIFEEALEPELIERGKRLEEEEEKGKEEEA